MKIQPILSVIWDAETKLHDAEMRALKAKHHVNEIQFIEGVASFSGSLAIAIGLGGLTGLVAKGIATGCAGLVHRSYSTVKYSVHASATAAELAAYERFGMAAAALIFAAPAIARQNWGEVIYSLAGWKLKGGLGPLHNAAGSLGGTDEFWKEVMASGAEFTQEPATTVQLIGRGQEEIISAARVACEIIVQSVVDQMPEIHKQARLKAPQLKVSFGGKIWGTQKFLDHRVQNWVSHLAEAAVWQNVLRTLRELYNEAQELVVAAPASITAAAALRKK